MTHDPHLSRRERQIMDAVYERDTATAAQITDALPDAPSNTAVRTLLRAQITDALPDAPSNTAVRTLLRILERKGHLTHIRQGREFVYKPTQPRQRAARSALRRLLDTFFEGSVEQALASYLADPKSRLSEAEMERLAELIEQARSNKR